MKYFVALLLLFFSCSNQENITNNNTKDQKPQPTGFVYFRLSDQDTIRYLDATDSVFYALPVTVKGLKSFDVSADGQILIMTDLSRIYVYDLLTRRVLKSVQPAFPPVGKITVNKDGRIAVYETMYHGRLQLALFFTDSENSLIIDSLSTESASSPLISPSGRLVAFKQTNGLYLAVLSNFQKVRLWNSPLVPDDFSPAEGYLSAEGLIFDLIRASKYPGSHAGKVKFISNYEVIWNQEPGGIFKKTTLSGSSETFLFNVQYQVQDFTLAPDNRFLVAVHFDGTALVFTVYDYLDRQLEYSRSFPAQNGQVVKGLKWPLKPSDFSGE